MHAIGTTEGLDPIFVIPIALFTLILLGVSAFNGITRILIIAVSVYALCIYVLIFPVLLW